MKVSFLEWLKQQTGRDDPIGRFALDAEADADAPHGASKREWLDYLVQRGAGEGASKAFHDAWDEFSRAT